MKLMVRLKNGKFNLQEALKLSLHIISGLLRTGIVAKIGLSPRELIHPSEFSLENLSSYFYKRHKEGTTDDIALLESRFGFHLPIYINLTGGVRAELSLRLGTPKISGDDSILFRVKDKYAMENFHEIMPTFETFSLFLIGELDPSQIVCNNFEFVKLFSEKDLAYDLGFIVYVNSDLYAQKKWTKMINLQPYKNGMLWESTFSSYTDSLNEVKDIYESI